MNKKVREIVSLILELLTGALSLMLASYLFKSFYVESFWYACLASILISVLSVYLKPLFEFLTLPINMLTLGLSSPLINVLILKVTSLVLGDKFIVSGWIIPFFIAIFISIVNVILNNLIVNPIKERR